jgi:hypothetical protein
LETVTGVTSVLGTSIQIDLDTFEISDKILFNAMVPVRVGYRYQKPEGGFFFRDGYALFF